jgi:hypothetical protein
MPLPALDVFISSTCYDLADLRAELQVALMRDGFGARLSEDPASSFFVDPDGDSVETCLRNVEASDVIICVIDRRYGGVIKHGERAGFSATHLEIRHAREHKKPVFFFVRERAMLDYDLLRGDRSVATRWVEPDDPDVRAKWLAMMKEIASLPKHEGMSNWCDQFRTSVELRSRVKKRLLDRFPHQATTLALHPERVVRVAFARAGKAAYHFTGSFQNIGPGPVYNVRHAFVAGRDHVKLETPTGGLVEGGRLLNEAGQPWHYLRFEGKPGADALERYVYCEYENRFGDTYRVEVPILMKDGQGTLEQLPERFFVRLSSGELQLVR